MATLVSQINEALVDQKVVKALRYTLTLLKSFSYQVESNGRVKNDSIYVPISTDPTEQDKTPGEAGTPDGTLAGVQVQLTNFKNSCWSFNEGEIRANLLAEAWADKAAGAMYVCAKGVIDRSLTLVKASNFGNTEAVDKQTTAIADLDQASIASFVGIGTTKIKQREKTILLGTQASFGLMGNSLLAITYALSGKDAMVSGTLPDILGVPGARYDAFPPNGENLVGTMFGRAALLVATAPPDPLIEAGQGNVVQRRIITDPESKISVLYTMTVDGAGKLSGECSLLSGCAVGQNAAVRLVTA